MPLTKNEVIECWYYNYEVKSDISGSIYIIEGANKTSCAIRNKITDQTEESTLEHLQANFSRVDDKKLGATIEEVDRELKKNEIN